KRFFIVRSLRDGDLIGKAVYYQNDLAAALAGDFEGSGPGVFEEGPEIAAEVGNARNSGQRGERDGHRLGGAGELRNSAQRAVGHNQRIAGIGSSRLRGCGAVQQIKPKAAPADEVISHLRVEFR